MDTTAAHQALTKWLDQIHCMDALALLEQLPDGCVNTIVTSPPYFNLRDYGMTGQIGLEESPKAYVDALVKVFREARRVLRDDGTLWVNLGDSYANDEKWGGFTGGKHAKALHGKSVVGRQRKTTGLKPKDLIGIPWRVAFALQDDGWYLRSDIIWNKSNPMPESVTDRPTKSHEYIFLLSKSKCYYYDHEAIKEPAVDGDPHQPRGSQGNDRLNGGLRKQDAVGNPRYTGFNDRYKPVKNRNKRTVWTVSTKPFSEAHFATYPLDLIEPCILAGAPVGGVVYDPFMGAGTTALAALKNDRHYIGSELNPEYVTIANKRLAACDPMQAFEPAPGIIQTSLFSELR